MPKSTKSEPQYWYNLRTGKVEFGLLSPAPDRIGPFESEESAKLALKIVAERRRQWESDETRED